MMQSICSLLRQSMTKIAAQIDRCVNHDVEMIWLYDELLDLAVVSGATGEVLFNSCVLQEAMVRVSKSVPAEHRE